MKPIKFKEQNITFAENQPPYIPLPAYRSEGEQGEVISCWHLTFSERLRLLLTGKLWVSLLSFHQPLTPSFLTTKKNDIFNEQKKGLFWKMRINAIKKGFMK